MRSSVSKTCLMLYVLCLTGVLASYSVYRNLISCRSCIDNGDTVCGSVDLGDLPIGSTCYVSGETTSGVCNSKSKFSGLERYALCYDNGGACGG